MTREERARIIRDRRDEKGWSQTVLAIKAGVSLSYVQKLEGARDDSGFRASHLQALAIALGLDSESLRIKGELAAEPTQGEGEPVRIGGEPQIMLEIDIAAEMGALFTARGKGSLSPADAKRLEALMAEWMARKEEVDTRAAAAKKRKGK